MLFFVLCSLLPIVGFNTHLDVCKVMKRERLFYNFEFQVPKGWQGGLLLHRPIHSYFQFILKSHFVCLPIHSLIHPSIHPPTHPFIHQIYLKLSMCACVWGVFCVCPRAHMEPRGQFMGIGLLPPCGTWRLSSSSRLGGKHHNRPSE